MVHGGFCGGWVFDDFRRPFEAAGHAVVAPDLPGHGADQSAAGLSMRDYARFVGELCAAQAQPILIGHSLGGLVAAMAAARSRVAGLILLAPSPPWGVVGSSVEEAASAASLYALGPFWLQAVAPSRDLARGYSLDRLAPDAQAAALARMRPESGRALFEALNWWLDPAMTTMAGRIDAPILAVAGGRDRIHPAATVRATAARLGADFKVFEEMSHWLPGEPGWRDVAETCLDWAGSNVSRAA